MPPVGVCLCGLVSLLLALAGGSTKVHQQHSTTLFMVVVFVPVRKLLLSALLRLRGYLCSECEYMRCCSELQLCGRICCNRSLLPVGSQPFMLLIALCGLCEGFNQGVSAAVQVVVMRVCCCWSRDFCSLHCSCHAASSCSGYV